MPWRQFVSRFLPEFGNRRPRSRARAWNTWRKAQAHIVRDTASNPDEITTACGIAHQSFDFRKRHSSDAGKKSPLVTIRIEINIQEYAVAVGARHVLQRQGDEVSKAALGHGVLARKETVIRIETELMP